MLGDRRGRAAVMGLALLAGASSAAADEGQWTPDQLSELDRTKLESLGLRLPVRTLWNETGGLMRAAVNLSGCSASFVSPEGLVATNHHCAYRAIQGNSSVEHDYLTDGFTAKRLEAELPALGYTVQVLDSITDVTATIAKAANGIDDDGERYRAIQKAQTRLVLECEKPGAVRCYVKGFYRGKIYQLFRTVELRDIRLVYAPPAAIGEYGGDVDNWMWPRHTGDFALMRAYAGPDGKPADYSKANQPYRPKQHLTIGHEGVHPGDFVAVMGYPGHTDRYLAATEVRRHTEQVFPALVDLYGEWIEILNQHAKADEKVAIKVAAHEKSLRNRHKNARGMLAGIRRMKLVERRDTEERKLLAQVKQDRQQTAAIEALGELSNQRHEAFAREFLLSQLGRGPNLLAVAIDLVRRSRERAKPELEQREQYMSRNASRLWKHQQRRIDNFDAEVDAALLASLAVRAAKLPKSQRIDALAALAGGNQKRQDLAPKLLPKLRASKLSDAEHAKRLFETATSADLAATNDPMIALARKLADDLEAMEARQDARHGRMAKVGPVYFEALKAVRKGPIYPDANGTLRLSFATVKGYQPADGLLALPQTTLQGAVAKHTGEPPFDLPAAVLRKAEHAATSYWADPGQRDVPVCFLSTADTTGGNSGSPVIDGEGRLVGLNFDRVWENIAGDFGYSDVSRNISVDIRYMLWLLDRVENATRLLQELGVARFRSAPARSERAAVRHPRPGEKTAQPPAPSGCDGCRLPASRRHSWVWLGAGVLLGVLARRRRTWRSRAPRVAQRRV